ncbi:MAG: hypothetical protein XU10_C0030G0017 [Chloroflexi bacterium CSP1-4]|nr:MAG: hypothetical protein XU10_C0030G0017 [Chloroflexi bacterium CSP1-4]
MSDLHRLAAELGLALGLLSTAWAAFLLVARRQPSQLFFINLAWTTVVLAVAGLLGGLMAVTGAGPRDILHIVYGVFAVATIPVAAFAAAGREPGRRRATWTIAGVVLVILVLRLFQTGA